MSGASIVVPVLVSQGAIPRAPAVSRLPSDPETLFSLGTIVRNRDFCARDHLATSRRIWASQISGARVPAIGVPHYISEHASQIAQQHLTFTLTLQMRPSNLYELSPLLPQSENKLPTQLPAPCMVKTAVKIIVFKNGVEHPAPVQALTQGNARVLRLVISQCMRRVSQR